jgi:hypothetical protein
MRPLTLIWRVIEIDLVVSFHRYLDIDDVEIDPDLVYNSDNDQSHVEMLI